jgi:hypothetical protein
MTEWYSHFDARQLSMVMEAQEVIAGGKKPGKKTGEGRGSGEGQDRNREKTGTA